MDAMTWPSMGLLALGAFHGVNPGMGLVSFECQHGQTLAQGIDQAVGATEGKRTGV